MRGKNKPNAFCTFRRMSKVQTQVKVRDIWVILEELPYRVGKKKKKKKNLSPEVWINAYLLSKFSKITNLFNKHKHYLTPFEISSIFVQILHFCAFFFISKCYLSSVSLFFFFFSFNLWHLFLIIALTHFTSKSLITHTLFYTYNCNNIVAIRYNVVNTSC